MNLEEYRESIPNFDAFLESMQKPQPYWIRVNTLKIEEEKLISRLSAKGFKFEKFGSLNAYRIVSMPVKHPGATIEHSLGYYYVQDLASMIPAYVLNPRAGDTVLDMAAAPGSKTTLMAQLMENSGTIVANDTRPNRLRALGSNIERLGITNTVLTKGDARTKKFGMYFDKILLDAPCSGEGVYRKNPKDKMPGLREHMYLSNLQKSMLKNAWRHLKEHGTLVYSTCTFNPLENEEVVSYAVSKLNMEPLKVEFDVPHCKGLARWRDREYESVHEYVMRIYPHLVDTGGMFIALLKK